MELYRIKEYTDNEAQSVACLSFLRERRWLLVDSYKVLQLVLSILTVVIGFGTLVATIILATK